ncbi:hydroxyacylglutathione hydrolase [Rothia dentocariosa]|uniref:Hydroxyacylglutathione hydrolase n=1 Tax=Rothia dentocariosa TaxID=2047 RepID=A0A3S5AFL5_9MICC|nr:hydroxyacylglutathione hydrolase [Rothia dentocariosa]
MTEIIERVVTHGTFSLDGGTWEVDNNVWIIGNDQRVTIIDPAHDVDKIAKKVAGRTVERILLTHAHDDHIRSAQEASERFKASVYLNPEDRVLWEMVYPSWDFDGPLHDGQKISAGNTELHVIATPDTPPGRSVSTRPNLAGKTAKVYSFRAILSSRAVPERLGVPTATSTLLSSLSSRSYSLSLSLRRFSRVTETPQASV